MNNIDYYINKKNSVLIKYLKCYNMYYEGFFEADDIKSLICSLIRDNEINAIENVLKELFENYKYDKDYEFDKYFKYNNNFILRLLIYYKNKIKVSKKEFKLLLIKEKEDKSNSIVNFIIDDCYSNYRYSYETSPLHIACSYGYKEIIKMLINYGANININNSEYLTPLTVITENYDDEMILLLINYNADINAVDIEGNTILHRAVRNYNLNALKLLLNYKVNINVKNNNGETPLHLACGRTNQSDIVKYLINHGADVNVKNNNG